MKRETSPELLRLKYLFRWARYNGIHPKGSGADPFYNISYVTPHQMDQRGRWTSRPPIVEATYVDDHFMETVYELGHAEMLKAALKEAELEALFAKKGSVWGSPDLYDALDAAVARCKRDDVKSCADAISVGPVHAGDIAKWMTFAMELSGSGDRIVFGVSGSTMFFFKCSEQEAVRRLSSLPDAVRVATPKKVLVKMLASRMKDLQTVVAEENRLRAENRKTDDEQAALKPGDPNHIPHYHPLGLPDVEWPEMDSVEKCRAAIAGLKDLRWDLSRHCKSFEEVLDKENMDEDVVVQAWHRTLVRNVMDS